MLLSALLTTACYSPICFSTDVFALPCVPMHCFGGSLSFPALRALQGVSDEFRCAVPFGLLCFGGESEASLRGEKDASREGSGATLATPRRFAVRRGGDARDR